MATPKNLHTPRGLARFPKLVEPDEYLGKTQYKTDLIFDPADAEVVTLLAQLAEKADESMASVRKDLEKAVDDAKNGAERKKAEAKLNDVELAPYVHDVLDRESGEPTGNIFLRFKTNADDRHGNRKKLRFFDSKGQAYTPHGDIGFNSVLRVNFSASPAYIASQGKVFLTNYINGVQVIELGGSGGSAAEMGFAAVEGGFDSSDVNGDFQGTEEVSVSSDGSGSDY